jgi:4-nitrophenyl phosphatase
MTVSGAIVDLDGTVYVGGSVVDGVPAGVDALRAAGLDVLFFSNNPLLGAEAYVQRLRTLGVDAREGETISAGEITAATLRERHAGETVFCIGAEGFREQLDGVGLELTDDPAECEVLVVSWTAEFDYDDMRHALAATDAETPFYGTDPDRTFQSGDDQLLPGSGAIIGAVGSVLDREPDEVFGKPSSAARDHAVERLGVPADECLVVGDRLDTDLEMGFRSGMTTVLVLSGVTDREQLAATGVEPDYVIDTLGEIDRVLEEL